MSNKHGVVELSAESILWLWRLIPLSIVIILFFAIAVVYLSAELDTQNMQRDLVRETVHNCISTFPGKIASEKITEENLRKCYSDKNWGYRVTLQDYEKKTIQKRAAVLTRQQETDLEICTTKQEVACSTQEVYTIYDNDQQGWLI